jgi:hypothetical protein
VSNRFLEGHHRLSSSAHATLLAAGWKAPADTPDGSPNYFRDAHSPVEFDEVAALAVQTLREIYGATEPAALTYKANSWRGESFTLPALGIPKNRR